MQFLRHPTIKQKLPVAAAAAVSSYLSIYGYLSIYSNLSIYIYLSLFGVRLVATAARQHQINICIHLFLFCFRLVAKAARQHQIEDYLYISIYIWRSARRESGSPTPNIDFNLFIYLYLAFGSSRKRLANTKSIFLSLYLSLFGVRLVAKAARQHQLENYTYLSTYLSIYIYLHIPLARFGSNPG